MVRRQRVDRFLVGLTHGLLGLLLLVTFEALEAGLVVDGSRLHRVDFEKIESAGRLRSECQTLYELILVLEPIFCR